MQPKDAIDIAYKNADFAIKNMQFFIIVSVALGGWVLSSKYSGGENILGWPRVILALLYFCISVISWIAHTLTVNRIDASFALARTLADDKLAEDDNFQSITDQLPRYGSRIWLPIIVALVLSLILMF